MMEWEHRIHRLSVSPGRLSTRLRLCIVVLVAGFDAQGVEASSGPGNIYLAVVFRSIGSSCGPARRIALRDALRDGAVQRGVRCTGDDRRQHTPPAAAG